MKVLGLTGGVASGKTLVAAAFRRAGAATLSADDIAHEVTAPGTEAVARIAAEFGPGYVRDDGSLDRGAMADLVFQDPSARKRLEAIVHPIVLERIRAEIGRLRNLPEPPEVLVVEVPLLYEVGIADWFDKVIVVVCSPTQQVRRLRHRDGLTHEAAMRRVQAQMPLSEKAALADYVIENEDCSDAYVTQVEEIMARVRTDCRENVGAVT